MCPEQIQDYSADPETKFYGRQPVQEIKNGRKQNQVEIALNSVYRGNYLREILGNYQTMVNNS